MTPQLSEANLADMRIAVSECLNGVDQAVARWSKVKGRWKDVMLVEDVMTDMDTVYAIILRTATMVGRQAFATDAGLVLYGCKGLTRSIHHTAQHVLDDIGHLSMDQDMPHVLAVTDALGTLKRRLKEAEALLEERHADE